MHKKLRGYQAEQLVKKYYEQQWWKYICSNFTIRGWEIDLIFIKHTVVVFIEVKVINAMDILHEYITPAKRMAFKRAISHFLRKYKCYGQPRVDIVFVKKDTIFTVCENCLDF